MCTSRSVPLPTNPVIADLYKKREELVSKLKPYDDAIRALQALCAHEGEQDLSRHLYCYKCGKWA